MAIVIENMVIVLEKIVILFCGIWVGLEIAHLESENKE